MKNLMQIIKLSLSFLIFLFFGCKKTSISEPQLLKEGQLYQGGVIGYLLCSGDPGFDAKVQHGIIFDTRDPVMHNLIAEFGGMGTKGVAGIKVGTGRSNTDSLVECCKEPGSAVRMCDELVLNGFKDWYLPSKDELIKIGKTGWSSSNGLSKESAWALIEVGGANMGQYKGRFEPQLTNKAFRTFVCAVRSF